MLDVLLVEDDDDVRECIASALEEAGHYVVQASDGGRAATLLASRTFDLAICDVNLPSLGGLTLARRARAIAPGTAIVVMSGEGSVTNVVAAMRDGALDYVQKPFDPQEFVGRVIEPIAERRALRKRFEAARHEWVDLAVGLRVVAVSPPMRALTERLKALAQSDSAVLLHGEHGSGRKTLARLIHEESPRRHGPYVVVPCVSVLEKAGPAGTGPQPGDGWFWQAKGGTLVLDGVDRVGPQAHAHLAALLSEVDARARRDPDWSPRGVRVVATAETDLVGALEAGQISQSLFFRFSAASLFVPPLRERHEDLLPLIAGVLCSLAPRWAAPPPIEPSAYLALQAYGFPGNVTELTWALEHALLMADTAPIERRHLPARVRGESDSGSGLGSESETMDGLPM
jgi:DNA-binding NtrC family response regulator